MRVSWAMWCVDALHDETGHLSIWKVYRGLPFAEFPAEQDLTFVIRFDADAADWGHDFIAEFSIVDPNGAELVPHRFPMRLHVGDETGDWRLGHQIIVHLVETEFPETGEYELRVFIDGNPAYELALGIHPKEPDDESENEGDPYG